MESNIYFLIFELLGFIFFALLAGYNIYKRNFRRLFELLSCVVFGLALEICHSQIGETYTYSENFIVRLANVPVAIGLGWAIIIYCSMSLTDQYNISEKVKPFMDALLAIIVDLAIDAVAIRLGFWSWLIAFNEEWYGVPFENFVGWIFVALSFSFTMRYLRKLDLKSLKTKLLYLFSPLISYLLLFIGLLTFFILSIIPYGINHNWKDVLGNNFMFNFKLLYNPEVQLWKEIIFVVLLVQLLNITVWSIISNKQTKPARFGMFNFFVLSSIHLFFAVAVFTTGLYHTLPILIYICFGSFCLHLIFHILPYKINSWTNFIKHLFLKN